MKYMLLHRTDLSYARFQDDVYLQSLFLTRTVNVWYLCTSGITPGSISGLLSSMFNARRTL